MHVGEINIGEADGAAIGQVVVGQTVLGDRTDEILRGDDRRVIGASDGHREWAADDAAVTIINRHRVNQRQRVARPQEVECAVDHAVGQGRRTIIIVAGGGDHTDWHLHRRNRGQLLRRQRCGDVAVLSILIGKCSERRCDRRNSAGVDIGKIDRARYRIGHGTVRHARTLDRGAPDGNSLRRKADEWDE